ncbi:hypothetical protein GOODEAATRI_026199 [Goodea atripinnis]|uniref:Uncharacterized protein n=1 Tax=Goodea atripinnis TaxID=208336 RepID=A0ABV0NDT4_9TELE
MSFEPIITTPEDIYDFYSILPLSEALDDLYKEFNALKERLGDLTEKFTGIESFIDEVKSGLDVSVCKEAKPLIISLTKTKTWHNTQWP